MLTQEDFDFINENCDRVSKKYGRTKDDIKWEILEKRYDAYKRGDISFMDYLCGGSNSVEISNNEVEQDKR